MACYGNTHVKVPNIDALGDNDVFIEWTEPETSKPIESTLFTPEETLEIARQPWRTIVSHEGWKLNLSPGDQCELYDLNNDPYEEDTHRRREQWNVISRSTLSVPGRT